MSHKNPCFYKIKCQIHLRSNFTPICNSTPWKSIALNYECSVKKTEKKTTPYSRSGLQIFTVLNSVTPLIPFLCLLIKKGTSIHLLVVLPVGCLHLLGHSLLSFRGLPCEGTVVLWAGFGCFSAGLWLQPKSILISHLNISVGQASLSTISARYSQRQERERARIYYHYPSVQT